VESKLERSHQAIVHFANTGMGNKLADALTLAGIALYNLHIRQRLLMGSMPAVERANVPAGYQGIPAHTNHSRLHFINQLARQAGIDCDVHTGITKLQPDNGEKFLSEYLGEQLTRNEMLAPHPETSRCMCSKCGTKVATVVNPYAKKRNRTESDDRYVIKRTRKRQKSDVDEPVELVVGVPVDLAPAVSTNDSGAALNKRHADIFRQQMKLLDDYGANMAQHQADLAQKGTIQAFPTWPRKQSKQKSEVDSYCCHPFLKYMLKRQSPFCPPVKGRPPHAKDCTLRCSDCAQI
jgi:hypothetical protein